MKDKQWYVDQHRAMWNWIADQIEKRKQIQDILILKSDWCKSNDVNVKGNCFACQYSYDEDKNCDDGCLFNWSDSDDFVSCFDSYYLECHCVFLWQKQAALARKIANLPVREDV